MGPRRRAQALHVSAASNLGTVLTAGGLRRAQTRSVFGLFVLPAKYYPWVLLVVWQLLMPGVSFLGHLGGVAAGQAFAWGWLRWALPPASAFQVRAGLRCLKMHSL